MPKAVDHSFIKKRKILYETKDKNTLTKTGDDFFAEGLIDDALDFYEQAKSEEGFEKVLKIGMEEGNLYLYRKICKIRRKDPEKAHLNSIGEKALELKKYTMALEAFKLSGNDGMRKKVEGIISPEKEERQEDRS